MLGEEKGQVLKKRGGRHKISTYVEGRKNMEKE